jgi:nitrogen fixation protein FixH
MKQERSLWAFVPAGLLTLMVAGLVGMARIAADDPSFSVEPRYYEKAVAWDAHQAQLQENERLGWKLEARTQRTTADNVELRVRLLDRRDRPIPGATVSVEAFHNARAADLLQARLDGSRDGYRTDLPMRRAGLWELRFTALSGAHTFTDVVRLDLR